MLLPTVRIRLDAIRSAIAVHAPETVLDEPNFQDKGIHLHVRRVGAIRLQPAPLSGIQVEQLQLHYASQGLTLNYSLPLKVLVTKRVLGQHFSATGQLHVELQTALGATTNWELRVQTEVENVSWIERPELQFGGLRIGGERLANAIVKRSRSRIAAQVDEQLRQQLDLQGGLRSLVARAHEGLPLPPGDVQGRLYPRLQALGFEFVRIDDEELVLRIGALASPQVEVFASTALAGSRDKQVAQTGLAPYIQLPKQGDSVEVVVQLHLTALAELMAGALLGLRFARWGREVALSSVELRSVGGQLVVELDLTGALQGTFTLSGKPVFDADSARIELHQPEVELTTNRAVLNVLAKALKPAIAKRVNEQLGQRLNDGLALAKARTNERLKHAEPVPGVQLEGAVHELRITGVQLRDKQLEVSLRLRADAELLITKLPSPPQGPS